MRGNMDFADLALLQLDHRARPIEAGQACNASVQLLDSRIEICFEQAKRCDAVFVIMVR